MPSNSVLIPNANQFRDWLIEVCEILEVRPSPFATGAGASINAARKFMSGKQCDVRLETANLLYSHAVSLAKLKSVELPKLPEQIALETASAANVEVLEAESDAKALSGVEPYAS